MSPDNARILEGHLAGRSALVTGGSRGIGKAASEALVDAGARVAVIARDPARTEEAAAALRRRGGQAEAFTVDVADPGAVNALVDRIYETWGRIDILVNNAGVTRDSWLMRMTDEDFDRVVAVNLKGMFNFSRAAAQYMVKARSGRIVNMSSVVGLMGNAGQVNYAAAKAGVVGLTKALARELAPRGVTVNAIAPGFIQTDMTAHFAEEKREQVLKMIPLARLGTPADVAPVVLFLCSDLAAYVTGQVLAVDGGMYI
ncbi:MAG: 3-oxoacyl-[acyl-carrier-protein] reductase [Planctomycetota bacterium]